MKNLKEILDKLQFGRSWRLSKMKGMELEFYHYKNDPPIEVSFSYIPTHGDHAGLNIGFCIKGYTLHFSIYDFRHWNWETNQWETKEDEIKIAEAWKKTKESL